jgi:integrase
MNEVDTPKGLTKTVETFSAEEIKMLLDKAKDHRLSAFFILACHTGARRGELLALRWSDFDSAKQTISISKTRGMAGGQIFENSPKTKRGNRIVEITSDTVSALLAHKEKQDELVQTQTKTQDAAKATSAPQQSDSGKSIEGSKEKSIWGKLQFWK